MHTAKPVRGDAGTTPAAVVDTAEGRSVSCVESPDPDANMKQSISMGRIRSPLSASFGRKESNPERGQALLETVMSVGFLVAIAIAMNKMLRPVIVDAFEKIAAALSSVGP